MGDANQIAVDNMKVCSKCKIEKNDTEFYRDYNVKNGLRFICKKCFNGNSKKYTKKYRNSKKYRDTLKKYHQSDKFKEFRKSKGWIEYRKQYDKEYGKEYEKTEKCRIRRRNYKKSEKYKEYLKLPIIKVANNLRSRLYQAIKRNYKAGSAVRDLGCSIEYLKKHLEKQFQKEMTWDNYGRGGWHIDHKNQLVKFDLTNRNEFLQAVNYTNLQPLWEAENCAKNSHR